MKSLIIRGTAVAILAFCVAYAVAAILAGSAKAMPDPYMPLPPVWCPGGGVQTPWGGYCDGMAFPDGTKLHAANGMGFWLPAQCVLANAPAPPPLAPGGCGGLG